MFIRQLSVFVENKPGRLSTITSLIAEAGIDVRALCVADTTNFGILRLIVNKPEEAETLLKNAGLTVSLTNVIAVGVPDLTGGFASAIKVLSDKGIAVEYMYAFVSRRQGSAYVILRVDDNDAAVSALKNAGIEILDSQDVI